MLAVTKLNIKQAPIEQKPDPGITVFLANVNVLRYVC